MRTAGRRGVRGRRSSSRSACAPSTAASRDVQGQPRPPRRPAATRRSSAAVQNELWVLQQYGQSLRERRGALSRPLVGRRPWATCPGPVPRGTPVRGNHPVTGPDSKSHRTPLVAAMCRTPHWVAVPESSERGRPAREGPATPAAPLTTRGTDSGDGRRPRPDVPLPHAPAAIILEVAPVQTQTLDARPTTPAGTARSPGRRAVPAQTAGPRTTPRPSRGRAGRAGRPARAGRGRWRPPPEPRVRPGPGPPPERRQARPPTCSASTCARSAASRCSPPPRRSNSPAGSRPACSPRRSSRLDPRPGQPARPRPRPAGRAWAGWPSAA